MSNTYYIQIKEKRVNQVREEYQLFKSGNIPNNLVWPDSPQPNRNQIYVYTPF